jgi:hypothetical protein
LNHSKLFNIGLKKRNGEIPDSWQDLAQKYSDGFFPDGESYRCWVKNRIRTDQPKDNQDISKEQNFNESHEIHKDGTQSSNKLVKMSLEQTKDPSYLLLAHGFDSKAWELISARNNIWNAYSKKDGILQLYSSKITVKPRKDEFGINNIKEIFEEMSKFYKSPVHIPTIYSNDGRMLEINISDLHLGKVADSFTSNDIYNQGIAKERFLGVINDVINRTKHYKFEKILFVFSQDFFHHEGLSTSTTSGTKMETDLRWHDLFKTGVQLLVEGIDMLTQFAPVYTLYIESNHDRQISYYALEYLYAWYRSNPNVTIDNSPLSRKYVEFGQNLIGFAHGHNEKKRIAHAMPVDAKEAWGRTSYREFHLGHLHSEQMVQEQNGIIVRHISSVTGTDAWHYSQGFIGSQKKAQSFVYDKERGLLDILHTVY